MINKIIEVEFSQLVSSLNQNKFLTIITDFLMTIKILDSVHFLKVQTTKKRKHDHFEVPKIDN